MGHIQKSCRRFKAQEGGASADASGGDNRKQKGEGFFYGSCCMFNDDYGPHHTVQLSADPNREAMLSHSIDRSTEFLADT